MDKKMVNNKILFKMQVKSFLVHRFICIFILSVFIFGAATNSFSQSVNGLGKYGATFLQISTYARQVAMGEAATGLADDVSLLRYNIGGLSYIEKTTMGINFHNWIKDTRQGAIGVILPKTFGTFGINFTYFNEGEITEFDENFTPTGAIINSSDIELTLGFGIKREIVGLDVFMGAGSKIVRQNLADQTATALGLDLGILIRKGRFSYGATVQNFNITKLKFIDREVSLPETYRGGIGYNNKIGRNFKLNIAADIAWLMDQKIRSYTGIEIIISDVFAIRGGYKFHDFEVNRWGAGLGLYIPMKWLENSRAQLDYALTPLDAFDGFTHRISLAFQFRKLEELGDTEFQAEKIKISELTEQLRQELEAAEKARIAAQEAERRTKEYEKLMAERLERVQQIAKESRGKIEVHTETPTDSVWVTMRINFDFDKANIRPDEYETLHRIAQILNTYPGTKVHISGHTDFIGTEEYNIRLSHRRIDSVMTYLNMKEKIELDRFYYPVGYGKQRPIASNATREGRFKNRRVDFVIYTTDNPPPIPKGSAIKSIKMLDDKTVKIICNGKVNFEGSFISNPDRIVLDFPGIFLLLTESTIKFDNDIFIRARLGYHPEEKFSRIVLDLRTPIKYKVITKDNIIYVRAI